MLRSLAVGMLLLALVAPSVQADWPQFHNDSRKTGAVSGSSYQVYKDVWWSARIPNNSTIEASPVVSGGIVVIGGWDKVVRAYDAASGKSRWNYTMTDKIVSSPAIQDGRVYAVDIKGALVSLDLQTGRKYANTTVGATLAPVTVHEGTIYIGTEGGLMRAFEVKSSDSVITQLWTFNVASFRAAGMSSSSTACVHPKAEIRSAAAVHDGVVYFGAWNNYVYAINEGGEPDGTVRARWVNQTGGIVNSAPSVDSVNSRVYFGSYDGKLRAFSTSVTTPSSCPSLVRAPTWTYSSPDNNAQMRSSPANDGVQVYIGTNSGLVLAVRASDGSHVWGMRAGNTVASSPAVANNVVVVGSDDKNVYWLSAHNGTVLRQFAAQSAVKSSPAIDGDRAFAASFDGTIYMFGPEIPRRADLVVSSVKYADGTVTIVVKNQGDAASGATSVRLLQGGTFVANVALEAIEPGQTRTVTQSATVTAATSFKAIADPDGTVNESTESNNEKEQSVQVAPPTDDEEEEEDGDGGGGLKIPSAGFVWLAAALALAALAARRQRR